MKSDIPERTYQFATRIVRLCKALGEEKGTPQVLMNQILRPGTSIGANVAEAQGSESRADFIHKYSIACKEARETLYWLRLLADTDIVSDKRIGPLKNECNELVAILTSIIKKSRSRDS